MANYRAIASGNWNTGSTWAGGSVPPNGQGHNIYSNTYTVTIDTDVDVALITNAALTASFVGGGTSSALGGSFTLGSFNISGNATAAAATTLLNSSGSVSPTIVGNILVNPASASNVAAINHSSSGTLNITGNVTGSANNSFISAITNSSNGSIVITGNVTAGGVNTTNLINNASSGSVTITGICTAGSVASASAVINSAAGSVTVIGTVIGSASAGVHNNSTGSCSVTGNVTAGNTASGALNASTGSFSIIGDITASNGANGFTSTNVNATNRLSGSFTSASNGTAAIYAMKHIMNVVPLNAKTRYALNGISTFVDMFTADNSTALNQAAPTDVRSGVAYGIGNSQTGRLTVPARGSVALSVNYGPSMPFTATRSGTTATATLAYSYPLVVGDEFTVTGASNAEWNSTYTIASVVSGTEITFAVPNTHSATAGTGALLQTTGTAVLDPAAVASAVWGAASRTITGGLVDTATTLTNAPTVPSVVQIRQEMDANSVKLANLDASVSSRSTLTAAQVNAEADTALADIGLTSTVTGRIDAAISSRLSPSGTLAVVTTLTNAPTSVTPSDIWSHATRTITGGTVDTLTNAPTVPSAAAIRAEIDSNSTQLAAIKSKTDALPASPAATGDIPSANISAIKAKTDLLVTDRLAQCSTVATTGAQLAAALS
jgi:hypothetical protein